VLEQALKALIRHEFNVPSEQTSAQQHSFSRVSILKTSSSQTSDHHAFDFNFSDQSQASEHSEAADDGEAPVIRRAAVVKSVSDAVVLICRVADEVMNSAGEC
jgi:hypothetical protein